MDEIRSTCRSCGSSELAPVLEFGEMPLADALAPAGISGSGEERHQLSVVFCRDCCLVQIRETVPPQVLFGEDYPYYSSFSDELLRHSRENVLQLIEARGLGPESLVVELASNDGYLLKNFAEHGIPVLGIDPAPGPVKAALAAGIPTMCEFFGSEMAQDLKRDGVKADVIIGNNVLAHVADLNGFVAGIATLLAPDGVVVIEAPYLRDLIDRCEFDTIYHEHHCYFSVSSVVPLFKRHGLTLNNVEHLPIHGGSLRYFASFNPETGPNVTRYLEDEKAAGMTSYEYYHDFAERASRVKQRLIALLEDLKRNGKRIAAYGAAAKGATLLNFTGADDNLIDFVVDRNVHKQGLFMPGVRIPIRDPEELVSQMPDYALILAWNFKDEIMRQQEAYERLGGKWIVPIPQPSIVTTEKAGTA
ncbi:MAG TPA: class I SAM-dependent methyltransferase [Dehalococcoidia bacterium]|nr:class I SAM-dependent methyltransferase [Dehalococcoidia bacterium]